MNALGNHAVLVVEVGSTALTLVILAWQLAVPALRLTFPVRTSS